MNEYSIIFSVSGYIEVVVKASSLEEATNLAWDKLPEKELEDLGVDSLECDVEDIAELQ